MIKLATDEKLHACMFGSQLHVQLQFIDEFKYFQFRSVSVVISSTLSNSQPIKRSHLFDSEHSPERIAGNHIF